MDYKPAPGGQKTVGSGDDIFADFETFIAGIDGGKLIGLTSKIHTICYDKNFRLDMLGVRALHVLAHLEALLCLVRGDRVR